MNPRRTSVYLYLVAKINPAAWDAIIPHSPLVSVASREYLIAMALKGFSGELNNKTATARLGAVQKTLVAFAGQQLAADYDDDNWCGTPYPGQHGPGPVVSFEDVMLNPQPLPPKQREREIGGYLVMLSEATTQQAAAKELQALGNSLLSSAAEHAAA